MPESPGLVIPRAENLTEARKESGLSYRALAHRLAEEGVPTNFGGLPKIFHGQPTSIGRAHAIAVVLGKPIQDLFTHGNGDPIGRHHV